MKEPKFGRWTSVQGRLPGRDERVLAMAPNANRVDIVTGAEIATDDAFTHWMPLPSVLQPPLPDDPQ